MQSSITIRIVLLLFKQRSLLAHCSTRVQTLEFSQMEINALYICPKNNSLLLSICALQKYYLSLQFNLLTILYIISLFLLLLAAVHAIGKILCILEYYLTVVQIVRYLYSRS